MGAYPGSREPIGLSFFFFYLPNYLRSENNNTIGDALRAPYNLSRDRDTDADRSFCDEDHEVLGFGERERERERLLPRDRRRQIQGKSVPP